MIHEPYLKSSMMAWPQPPWGIPWAGRKVTKVAGGSSASCKTDMHEAPACVMPCHAMPMPTLTSKQSPGRSLCKPAPTKVHYGEHESAPDPSTCAAFRAVECSENNWTSLWRFCGDRTKVKDGWQTVVFMCSGDFRAMVPCRFGSQNKTIQIANEVSHDRKTGPIENRAY